MERNKRMADKLLLHEVDNFETVPKVASPQ